MPIDPAPDELVDDLPEPEATGTETTPEQTPLAAFMAENGLTEEQALETLRNQTDESRQQQALELQQQAEEGYARRHREEFNRDFGPTLESLLRTKPDFARRVAATLSQIDPSLVPPAEEDPDPVARTARQASEGLRTQAQRIDALERQLAQEKEARGDESLARTVGAHYGYFIDKNPDAQRFENQIREDLEEAFAENKKRFANPALSVPQFVAKRYARYAATAPAPKPKFTPPRSLVGRPGSAPAGRYKLPPNATGNDLAALAAQYLAEQGEEVE